MNKGVMLGALGLAIVGAGAYGVSAFASQGRMGQFGPNYTAERHEKMLEAFKSGDYASWKSQMGNRGATKVVNEQNFSRFTQMHNLMLEGKVDEANKIRQELGLGTGQGRGTMRGGQKGQNNGGNFVDSNGDGKCDHLQ